MSASLPRRMIERMGTSQGDLGRAKRFSSVIAGFTVSRTDMLKWLLQLRVRFSIRQIFEVWVRKPSNLAQNGVYG